jgi:sigma-B regulation protein RsbU (phosphoserine phosphatase)
MNERVLDQFHESISRHCNELQHWLKERAEQKPVFSGTASVPDVLALIEEFRQLLEQIEDKSFGTCTVCQGEVELDRLEQDCTTTVCLDCYTEEQLRELERDLELAAKVQDQLLPGFFPSIPGVNFAVRHQSAQVVGGDYHDFVTLKNGQQGFLIGDVMGKGLAASMLMSNLQASLRILGPDYENLDQLFSHLNRLFRFNLKLIRFISLFIGAIDSSARKLSYCNAGHHSPVLWRSDRGLITRLEPTAPAIGLIARPDFRTETIEVDTGDLLVLYTDGLTEARDRRNQEFGEERLSDFIRHNYNLSAEEFTGQLWTTVKEYSGHHQDDTTLLVLKFV